MIQLTKSRTIVWAFFTIIDASTRNSGELKKERVKTDFLCQAYRDANVTGFVSSWKEKQNNRHYRQYNLRFVEELYSMAYVYNDRLIWQIGILNPTRERSRGSWLLARARLWWAGQGPGQSHLDHLPVYDMRLVHDNVRNDWHILHHVCDDRRRQSTAEATSYRSRVFLLTLFRPFLVICISHRWIYLPHAEPMQVFLIKLG